MRIPYCFLSPFPPSREREGGRDGEDVPCAASREDAREPAVASAYLMYPAFFIAVVVLACALESASSTVMLPASAAEKS